MSLSTYAGLKSAALRWIKRNGGSGADTAMDDAIDLAEARFNRVLRVAEMEDSADISTTSGVGTLPTDYLEWREVWEGTRRLTLTTPGAAQDDYAVTGDSADEFYIMGGSVYIFPTATTTVTIKYYQSIPALSDANTSNWLLAAHSDLYLYEVLSNLNKHNLNAQAAALWASQAADVVNEIIEQDRGKRYARAAIRAPGVHP